MRNKDSSAGRHDALRTRGCLNAHPDKVADATFQRGEFFDPEDLVQVKYEMLRRVRVDACSVTEAAADAGVSRPTYYESLDAFTREGLPGLVPRKRGPRGGHKLSAEVMRFVVEARATTPASTVADLLTAIRERFGLEVHRRSLERALGREKKRP